MCIAQFRCSSITIPRNLVLFTCCILFLSIFILLTFLLYDLPFDVKIMWFVLLILRTSLFVANQVDILINSWLVSLIKYSKLSCVWNKLVSSANRFILKIFETFAISFMYKMNSSGPNMDPWGTPQVTFMETEVVLLYDTNYHLNSVWTNSVWRLLYRSDSVFIVEEMRWLCCYEPGDPLLVSWQQWILLHSVVKSGLAGARSSFPDLRWHLPPALKMALSGVGPTATGSWRSWLLATTMWSVWWLYDDISFADLDLEAVRADYVTHRGDHEEVVISPIILFTLCHKWRPQIQWWHLVYIRAISMYIWWIDSESYCTDTLYTLLMIAFGYLFQ